MSASCDGCGDTSEDLDDSEFGELHELHDGTFLCDGCYHDDKEW